MANTWRATYTPPLPKRSPTRVMMEGVPFAPPLGRCGSPNPPPVPDFFFEKFCEEHLGLFRSHFCPPRGEGLRCVPDWLEVRSEADFKRAEVGE
jgi:hypothetical protein